MMKPPTIILASRSKSRHILLQNAGVEFETRDAGIDEDAVKQAFLTKGGQDLADVAMVLAHTKAVTVSEQDPDAWVIGADQILLCDNKLYNKPVSQDDARSHLLELSGKTHVLETAIAIARGGEVIWSYRDGPALTMRELTPQFIGRYMARVGDDVLTTVGGYKLEGLGIRLFDKIDGNYFSILGLPLLPLLNYLRSNDLIDL